MTPISSIDFTIHTLIPPAIRIKPYRNAMLTTLFLRQTINIFYSSFITISDLITTITLYFDINTGSAESKAERATDRIDQAFFAMTNLYSVRFFTSAGKSATNTDLANRPDDITFYLFGSVITASTVDARAPIKYLDLEFALFLPATQTPLTAPIVVSPRINPFSSPSLAYSRR